jgi:hypothetical protein
MRQPPAQTCAGTTKNGARCGIRVLVDGSFCFAHSPAYAQARVEARARGGRNRAASRRVARVLAGDDRLGPVLAALEAALPAVLTGSLDPRRAQAAAAVVRALVTVWEAGELEQRLRVLEGAVQSRRA